MRNATNIAAESIVDAFNYMQSEPEPTEMFLQLHSIAETCYSNFENNQSTLALIVQINSALQEKMPISKKDIKKILAEFKKELFSVLASPDLSLSDKAKNNFKNDFHLIAELILSVKSGTHLLQESSFLSVDLDRIKRIFSDILKYAESNDVSISHQESSKLLLKAIHEFDFLYDTYKMIVDKKEIENGKKPEQPPQSRRSDVIESFKNRFATIANWFAKLSQFIGKKFKKQPDYPETAKAFINTLKKTTDLIPIEASVECIHAIKNAAAISLTASQQELFSEQFLAFNPQEGIVDRSDSNPSFFDQISNVILDTPEAQAKKALMKHLKNNRANLIQNLRSDLITLKEICLYGFIFAALHYPDNQKKKIKLYIQLYTEFSEKILAFQQRLFSIRMQYADYYKEKETHLVELQKLDDYFIKLHENSAVLIKNALDETEALATNLQIPNLAVIQDIHQCMTHFEKTKKLSGMLTWLRYACYDFKGFDQERFKPEIEARIQLWQPDSSMRPTYCVESMHTLTDDIVQMLREAIRTKNYGNLIAPFHPDKKSNYYNSNQPEFEIMLNHFAQQLESIKASVERFLRMWDLSQYANTSAITEPDIDLIDAEKGMLSDPIDSSMLVFIQDYLKRLQEHIQNQDQNNTSSFATQKHIRGDITDLVFKLHDGKTKQSRLEFYTNKLHAQKERREADIAAKDEKIVLANTRADNAVKEKNTAVKDRAAALIKIVEDKMRDKFKKLENDISLFQIKETTSNLETLNNDLKTLQDKIVRIVSRSKIYESAEIQSAILLVFKNGIDANEEEEVKAESFPNINWLIQKSSENQLAFAVNTQYEPVAATVAETPSSPNSAALFQFPTTSRKDKNNAQQGQHMGNGS